MKYTEDDPDFESTWLPDDSWAIAYWVFDESDIGESLQDPTVRAESEKGNVYTYRKSDDTWVLSGYYHED